MPSHSSYDPPILRLPVELREQIYDYLLELETPGQGSHPLPGVGITSVSHAPPSLSLLLVHSTISTELLHRFYSQATLKTVISHAFNFFRTDPDLRQLESSYALKRMKRVELVFFQDILLLKEYPSFGLEAFCAEIRRRADRACDVLLQAPHLRHLTVSWVDTTRIGGWSEKVRMLEPLRKLKGKVDVSLGEVRVSGCRDTETKDRQTFKTAIEAALGLRLESSKNHTSVRREKPNELRMLALEIRQQRLNNQGVPV
ncbi:hypothetical protein Q7P37_001357 [Cladosporium fusiforme]